MNAKKIIIFDLDGTLYQLKGGSFADSDLKRKVLENVVKYIQERLNKKKNEATNILKNIQKEYGENISISFEKEYALKRQGYFNCVWNINPQNIIIKNEKLKTILGNLEKDYQFLLVSDAPRIWIDNVLKELNITSFFSGKIFSGEGDKRKIFENRFSDIIKKFGWDPKCVISVGDQENSDIIPAKKLGISTIYINKKKSVFADKSISCITDLEAALSYISNIKK